MVYFRQYNLWKLQIFFAGLLIGLFLTLNFRSITQLEARENKQDVNYRKDVLSVLEYRGGGENQKEYNKICQVKRQDIAFLKVHKCGSTTVSNILQRFGINNALNFVLPDKPHEGHFWVLGNVTDLKWKLIIPLPKGKVYNILSVDTFFNIETYRKLIPNNAFIMAIVREPVDRFVSMDFYEGRGVLLQKLYGTDPYIYSHIIEAPQTNELSAIRGMAYDFGLSVQDRENDSKITSFLNHVNRHFDFVLLMEYFDESLVLLKRNLCWEIQDIIYITKNQNVWNKKQYALSPTHRKTLQRIQRADVKLYDHFRQKLFKEIGNLGSAFLEEVHAFKFILKLVSDFCIQTQGPKTLTELLVPAGTWNTEFKVGRKDCELMLLIEFPLIKILQDRQRNIYNDSLMIKSI